MTTKIKERPILYSGPMVRATLRDIKTQTRRMVKETLVDQDEVYKQSGTRYGWMNCADIGKPQDFRVTGPVGVVASLGGPTMIRCPYGKPGDRLWVREKWAFQREGIFFAADQTQVSFDFFTTRRDMLAMVGALDLAIPKPYKKPPDKWRPSIHMPRWASRILLELTDVRVERLQEISEADAQAEGVEMGYLPYSEAARTPPTPVGYRPMFRRLWDSINGPGSWDANPWVWALTFKRLERANGR